MPAQRKPPGIFISGGSWVFEVASFNQTNLGLTRPKHHIQFHSPMSVSLISHEPYPKKQPSLICFFVDKNLIQLQYPKFSHVSPGFCEPKNQIPGVWITGSPGMPSTSHAPRSRPLHRAPWPPRRTTHRRRLGKWETQVAPIGWWVDWCILQMYTECSYTYMYNVKHVATYHGRDTQNCFLV